MTQCPGARCAYQGATRAETTVALREKAEKAKKKSKKSNWFPACSLVLGLSRPTVFMRCISFVLDLIDLPSP